MSDSPPRIGLFVTCLVNLFRPSIGFATIELLEKAGCIVEVPEQQTCCGQPGYNPGDFESTIPVAKQLIDQFIEFDYVVVPSGSCAGMIVEHYPKLLKNEPDWHEKAQQLAKKTWELTRFLDEVCSLPTNDCKNNEHQQIVTYHDSCAGLRELGIKDQPRRLLKNLANVSVSEMENTEECCGFGGTFCAKMPEISASMVDDKIAEAQKVNANLLLGGDLGCLLNIAGRATRINSPLNVRHVAEVLANKMDAPPIGKPREEEH